MFTETDGEKIEMHLRTWNSLKEQNPGLSQSKFFSLALKKIGERRVVYILEDPNLNALMSGIQHQTPVPWMISREWQIGWLSRVLVSPAGGVRIPY
jgi:hypothetical protein